MKKVLVLLAVVLGLGTSVVFAEGVKDAKKEQTVKKSPDFIEIYMNDVPETIMDTLACEGARHFYPMVLMEAESIKWLSWLVVWKKLLDTSVKMEKW